MAKPTTKQEFADYILRKLGAPLVNIEITDQQLEDVIDDAISYYYEWHHEGTQRSWRVVCLDENMHNGNNRRPQCLTAEYYNPDKTTYRVGDRVRATIDKDQGERIWIKYDSEDQSNAYKWVEYPAGDWFKPEGTDLFVLYDSDTSYIFIYENDTRGIYTKDSDGVYLTYDSDQHAFEYTQLDADLPVEDNGVYYFKNDSDLFLRAPDYAIWHDPSYTQTLEVPYDSEFKVFIKDGDEYAEFTVIPRDKSEYVISGSTSLDSDSDAKGVTIPKLESVNERRVTLTFADDKITIKTELIGSPIQSEVAEPLEWGLVRIQNPAEEFYYRTNDVTDDNQTIEYRPDSDTYHIGKTGIFIGPNAKWVLRETDSDYPYDSDVEIYLNNGLIVSTQEEYRNIPTETTNTYEIPMWIDGELADSEFWGTTKFSSLDGLVIHYDTGTTFITLREADNLDSDINYGSGYITAIHPERAADSDSDAADVTLPFWYGNYQNELDSDSKDSEGFYDNADVVIDVYKNGVDTGEKASTQRSYWPSNYAINYANSTWSVIDTFNGNAVVDSEELATAKITIPDAFQIMEDSEVRLAFLDGVDITNSRDINIVWPDPADSEIGSHKVGLLINGELKDSEYYYNTFDLVMRNATADSDIAVDFHGVYERSQKELTLYSREDKDVERFNRNRYLNGIRYIRLPQEAEKKYRFEDLWSLESKVLAEPELNLDYSITGQVGIPVPDDIFSIVKCFRIPVGHMGTTFGSFNYQLMMNQMGWYQTTIGSNWGFMTDLYIHMQYIELIEQQLNTQPPIRFNKHKNRLYIDTYWDRLKNSGIDYLFLEVYEITDPEVFGSVYNDNWLKRYATSLAKVQWGQNLIKYAGTDLPGGIQISGDNILASGKEEQDKLEEEMKQSFIEMDSIILG